MKKEHRCPTCGWPCQTRLCSDCRFWLQFGLGVIVTAVVLYVW